MNKNPFEMTPTPPLEARQEERPEEHRVIPEVRREETPNIVQEKTPEVKQEKKEPAENKPESSQKTADKKKQLSPEQKQEIEAVKARADELLQSTLSSIDNLRKAQKDMAPQLEQWGAETPANWKAWDEKTKARIASKEAFAEFLKSAKMLLDSGRLRDWDGRNIKDVIEEKLSRVLP